MNPMAYMCIWLLPKYEVGLRLEEHDAHKKYRKIYPIFKGNESHTMVLGITSIIEISDHCIGETWCQFGKYQCVQISNDEVYYISKLFKVPTKTGISINPSDPFQHHQRHLLAYSLFYNLCLPAAGLNELSRQCWQQLSFSPVSIWVMWVVLSCKTKKVACCLAYSSAW